MKRARPKRLLFTPWDASARSHKTVSAISPSRQTKSLCERTPTPVAFNPVAVAPVREAAALPLPVPSPEQAGTVEIEFATGGRMRITGSVDASTVSALIKGLAYGYGWPLGTPT
jgi:hypothetical protein